MVADAEGNVWVSSKASIVTRLAFGPGGTSAGPLTPSHTATIHIPPPGAASLALGAGYVWVIVGPLTLPGQDDRLSLVDLATDRVVNSLRLGRETTSIAFGDGAVWVGAFVSERKESSQPNPPWTGPSWLYVLRAGARRAQSYRVENGDACGPVVTVGEQRVWVLTCGRSNLGGRGQTLVEIDPDTRQVIKRIPLHNQSANQFAFLAAGGGSVWLTNQAANSVLQLDPSTGHIVRTIPLGRRNYASTCGIAATHDAVWVSIGDAYCDTVGR
jgi:DNA-binding beta-propeller fold protein YncE